MKNLKKFICLCLCMVMAIGLMAAPASAANLPEGVVESNIRITVNDEFVEFPDTKPLIKGGRTLIPVRFVGELMGADVTWDDANKTAVLVKGDITVKAKINDKNLRVIENGVERIVEMDAVAMNVNSRTVLPIRYVAEAFGAYVDWSSLYNICEIVLDDELTAEEIKRLRSYDATSWYLAEAPSETFAVWYDKYGATYEKYFSGDFAFANRHAFLCHGGIEFEYEAHDDTFTTDVVPVGAESMDFVKFCEEYIVNVLEQEYDYKNGNYVSWTCHMDDWLDATYKFTTCSGLMAQEIAPPYRATNVRGILEATFGEDTPKAWITDSFGIENPEYGKTYVLDVEFTIAMRNYHPDPDGFLNVAASWYFDENGAHKMERQVVANYHK